MTPSGKEKYWPWFLGGNFCHLQLQMFVPTNKKNLQSAKFNLCIYCLSSLLVTNQEALYKFSSLEVFKRLLTFSITVLENYHGTAIESPVSVFVAEIVLKNIDKCALSTRRKGCNHGYATLTIHDIPSYTKTESSRASHNPTRSASLTDRIKHYITQ